MGTVKYFLDFPRTRERIRGGKQQTFSETWSLFDPFCSILAKIRPEICPADPIFIRPILGYAAEHSASWQHWPMTRTTISTCGASHGANSRNVNVGNNSRNLMRVTGDERR
jgi:hypothetical protein